MIPYLPHILPLSAIRSNWIIMDDKRTFLAIALAIAVLLAWTPLAEHMGWIQPQQRPAATQEATPAPAPAAQTAVAPASSLPVFTPSAGTDVKVETPLYSAVIYSGGGILRSFTLKHYDETIKADSPKVNLISPEASQTAPLGLTVNGQPSWSTGQWSFQGSDLNLKAGEQGSLTFTGIVDGVRVTRVISFNADNYLLSENILVGSADQAPRTVRLGFTVAATPFSNGKYDPTRLAWDANESFKEETSASTLAEKGIIEQGVFNWAGVMSNYFMNVTAPADPNNLTLKAGEQGSLTFTGIVDGVRVTRVISFNADNYLLSENILVGSADQAPRTVRLGFTVAATPFSNGKYDPTRLAWDANESFKEETSASTLAEKGIIEQGVFNWAGVMSNYFMNVTAPADPNNLTLKGRVQGDVWRLALERPDLLTPSNGGEVPVAVNWWFGPKDRTMLATAPDHLSQAVNFGMFSIIARPLLTILAFFHSFVGNWGIAILMLTFCIRVVFWPLSQKSFKSMEQMKKLQPMMKKLREKHKDDKEALNKEMMQLYKTYKVNPAGGCLPIVVQIPVFIGLYQALLNSIELRHASFIEYLPFTHITWLADLSAADPFYITPLLMGASMFLQQRLTPAAGDPTQQKVMMFMPVIFTVMFINFPAGLVIYWLCNNILSIGQQWWMLRKA